ncbi:hypothetical protein [Kitasatospora sp. NPDC092286]|uniref:hypothetical protein n=1 Tax=Kitasatospora sp. NPDC092286 TaxID=3364087 RepID=UPI00380471D4
MNTARPALRAVFEEAGVRGHVFARDIDGPAALGLDEDTPVVLASVFKIPVALAYAREAKWSPCGFVRGPRGWQRCSSAGQRGASTSKTSVGDSATYSWISGVTHVI